jgi:hypothetical protein
VSPFPRSQARARKTVRQLCLFVEGDESRVSNHALPATILRDYSSGPWLFFWLPGVFGFFGYSRQNGWLRLSPGTVRKDLWDRDSAKATRAGANTKSYRCGNGCRQIRPARLLSRTRHGVEHVMEFQYFSCCVKLPVSSAHKVTGSANCSFCDMVAL